jgi:purine-binding chemotaxis protein CheW
MPKNTEEKRTPEELAKLELLAGKYMTFKLADEEYGVEILKVREIIGLMDVTRVPRTRPFIKGVINLRGKVIPVMDLGLRFGLPPVKEAEQTVIIVVQCVVQERKLTIGLLVDEVLEVLSIQPTQIEPPPDFGAGAYQVDFLRAIGKVEGRVVFLLDIETVLSWDNIPADLILEEKV